MPVYIVSHKEKFKQPIKNFRKVLIVGEHDNKNANFMYENTLVNIITRQRAYCEMSGLYWIWKNLNDDIVGLEHYRRYFLKDKKGIFKYHFLVEKDILNTLNNYDIILPTKKICDKSLWDDYLSGINNHVENDIYLLEEAVKVLSPGYYEDFLLILKENNGAYLCNMFISKRSLFEKYCEWAYPIYDYVFNKIDFTKRIGNQARAIGYLAERLFNVWIYHNNLKIKEYPILFVKENMTKMKIKRFIKILLRRGN